MASTKLQPRLSIQVEIPMKPRLPTTSYNQSNKASIPRSLSALCLNKNSSLINAKQLIQPMSCHRMLQSLSALTRIQFYSMTSPLQDQPSDQNNNARHANLKAFLSYLPVSAPPFVLGLVIILYLLQHYT
ncbi:hypothetical protein [Bo-Circo-like virus CH]|nr:hypothetical protein [Bo-Circo-like virus CH]